VTARVLQSGSCHDDPGPYIRFLFECEDSTLERCLELKVYLSNWSLKVEASWEWIIIEWEQDSITMHSIEGTRHRSMLRVRACEMIYYHWEVKHTKMTTRSLIEKILVLYFEKGELSKCLKYFLRVLIKHGIPHTRNFAFHEIESVIAAKNEQMVS
jgi:hypothetical protein